MRFNPIFKKEVTLGSRSMKFPLAIMFYALILGVVAITMLNSATNASLYSGAARIEGMEFDVLMACFMVLVYVQYAMICIIIPVLTAGSIAGERERQTLDIMLTAPISPFSIVLGKLEASLANVFIFIVSGLPALSLSFIYGGFQWKALVIFLLDVMGLAFFVGAIGIYCSSKYRKTIFSVIMTMILEACFFLGPLAAAFLIFMSKVNWDITTVQPNQMIEIGILPLLLLLDPAIGVVEGCVCNFYPDGIMKTVFENIFSRNIKYAPVVEPVLNQWHWLSFGIMLLFGLVFILLAAREVDSVTRKGKRAGRKKSRKINK